MIARHSHEQSEAGEGVEVVENKEVEDPTHGKGQYTEKRIHLNKYAWLYFLLSFMLSIAYLAFVHTW